MCNIVYPSETHLKLNSREISFGQNIYFSGQIVLKICTEHGSYTAMLCTKLHNDLIIDQWVMCKRDFAIISEFNNAQGPNTRVVTWSRPLQMQTNISCLSEWLSWSQLFEEAFKQCADLPTLVVFRSCFFTICVDKDATKPYKDDGWRIQYCCRLVDSFTVSLHILNDRKFGFVKWTVSDFCANYHWSYEAIMHCSLSRVHWTCGHSQTLFGIANYTCNNTMSHAQ